MGKTCMNCGTPITKEYCEGYPKVCNHWTPKKPQTNADRIRAMSDEELAAIIRCPYATYPDICRTPSTCLDCCEEWLRQPAEMKEDERMTVRRNDRE